MATTIDLITADFNATPKPTFEFLQGRNMDVLSIRTTLRAIEESEEGRLFEGNPDPDGLLVKSSGNEFFNEAIGEKNALTVSVLPVFQVKFQAGSIPFKSSGGNLLFEGLDSPGAIVQINNAVGAISLSSVDIEHASYDNAVTIDVANGIAGTTGTIGNKRQPSNNLTDAKTIAAQRGLNILDIKGAMTFVSTDSLDDLTVIGISTVTTNIFTIQAGCSTMNTRFKECTVVGTLKGKIDAEGVIFGAIIDMDYASWLLDSLFEGDISLKGGGNFAAINCGATNPPGSTARPTLDYTQVPAAKSNFLRWSGNIGFKGVTAGDISLSIDSGKVFLEASNIGGNMVIYPGEADIDDQSGAGFTVTRTLRPSTLVPDAIAATTIATDAITGAAIATDAIGSLEIGADAVQELVDGIRRQVLTEGYATNGSEPTLEQMMYMIWSALSEFSIAGTTVTSKKLNRITASMTHDLDDANNPTTRTRAT